MTPIINRILKVEPGVSLGQWCYDRVTNNFAILTTIFIGAGGMSVLAIFTQWAKAWGPLVVGAIGLCTASVIFVVYSFVTYLQALSQVRKAEAEAIGNWRVVVDTINPLDTEFHKKKIKLTDMIHPGTKSISRKSFTNCQIIGPINIFMYSHITMNDITFNRCDFIATKELFSASCITTVEYTTFLQCEFIDCTIFAPPGIVTLLSNLPGINFISLTGNPELDNRSPIGPETKMRR